MRSIKLAKFEYISIFWFMCLYYGFYSFTILILGFISYKFNGNMTTAGFEFVSSVFIFVTGITIVKSTFKFAQANNITRKTFFISTLITVPLITASMSVIDSILIRLFNLMIPVMPLFNMIYRQGDINMANLRPDNSFISLSSSFLWMLTLYASLFMLGILIGLAVYRSNRIAKLFLALIPVIIILLFSSAKPFVFLSAALAIGSFLKAAFSTPYTSSLSFIVLYGLYASISWLILRRLIIKD